MRLLEKDKKYVVACSFGPDSMALLNMVILEGYDVVVAHVNYHKRDVSNFEEESLKKYCLEHNVKFEVLDTSNLVCDKNFQEWAREVRYSFFKTVLDKYACEAVLVAHQQDDLIETYLMQKERNNFVKYWGIAEKTSIFNVKIIRPLLSYSKQDLLNYCDKNNVPYSIDESNLTGLYKRNQIRHDIAEKLTEKERTQIIDEIDQKNASIELLKCENISVQNFLNLNDEQITFFIAEFLEENDEHIDISRLFISEIRKAFSSDKNYVSIKLSEHINLTKDYELVCFIDTRKKIDYKLTVNLNEKIDNDLFEIYFDESNLDRNVCVSDFPLTIKPVDKNESIQVADYEVEVRRLFIDWKLSHRLRECWPGVYNKDGKLIYIPRYRENFVDNHTSTFVIKFTSNRQK